MSFRLDERQKAREFAAYFKDFEDRLAALERSNQLNHASIEGGSLDIYDAEGTLRGSVGVQDDGGVALVPVNTSPPPTPSPPVVEPVLAGLTIGWDGTWADAETNPSDFHLVQAHVGRAADFTPDVSTLVATITAPLGGTVTVAVEGYTPVWVRLVAANTAAITGEPSQAVTATPRQAVPQDLIDNIINEAKLTEGAVTAAKIALGAVGTTALADGAVLTEKLADNAVKAGKISQGAVTLNALGGALSDSAAQRYVDAMGDPAAWQTTARSTGATWEHLTGVTDAPTGQTAGQAKGYVRELGRTLIPYEPGTLYRVSARVRLTAAASGTETFFIGVAGYAADKVTLVNRNGANDPGAHYYAAASGKSISTADSWVTVVGYLKDRAAAGVTIPSSASPDPRAAGLVHRDVRFIAPYVWCNASSTSAASPTSVMQVDMVTIEALKTGLVDSTNLVAGSVTTAALATDSVTAGKVAADAISARELAAGSVTAAELAAGSVTANAVAAGSITAEKLTIVGSANILPDPSFEGTHTAALAAKYAYTTHDTAFGNGSAASLKITTVSATSAYRAVDLTALPITAGDQLYIATDYYPSADWTGSEINMHARWETADGTVLGYGKATTTTPARAAWGRLAATVPAPAGATWVRVRLEAAATAGSVHFDNAAVRPVVAGVQIADGAITAPKILAGAVTTDKLTALSVTGEKIAALAVTTDKLAALSVTADQVAANAVTATKIAAGAIEATHIKAGAITADKLDAEAITGKTITGGEINGATVTGGVLRTAASGQRVVIEPGGSNEVGSVKFFSGSSYEGAPGRVVTNIAFMSDGSGSWEQPSASLISPASIGSAARTGLYLAPRVPGHIGAGFSLYANDVNDAGVAQINAYGAEDSAVGSSLELSVKDAPPNSAGASVRLTSAGLMVAGVLAADSIAFGRVNITPSAADTPTPVSVTGLSLKGSNFRALATASTSLPGRAVTGVSVTNASATGLTIWLTRTNTTTTGVDWMLIGS